MKHNELSEDQIIQQIKSVGWIGRHKYKTSNSNINKKLNKMAKGGKIKILRQSDKFRYFDLTNDESYKGLK
jgi:hypothetical protein